MRPIYTAFYTVNTIYEQEAARLQRSLESHGLEFDLRGIESRGDWYLNTHYTATHILTMMRAYPDRAIVQLDADAVVWKYPDLFDQLTSSSSDIAVHYRRGHELLNGTMWVAPTCQAFKVIEEYERLVSVDPRNCHSEQRMLQAAIQRMPETRVTLLPAGYTFIHDIMKDDLGEGEPVVIEHLQCSREMSKTELLPNRRKRLAEIGG